MATRYDTLCLSHAMGQGRRVAVINNITLCIIEPNRGTPNQLETCKDPPFPNDTPHLGFSPRQVGALLYFLLQRNCAFARWLHTLGSDTCPRLSLMGPNVCKVWDLRTIRCNTLMARTDGKPVHFATRACNGLITARRIRSRWSPIRRP